MFKEKMLKNAAKIFVLSFLLLLIVSVNQSNYNYANTAHWAESELNSWYEAGFLEGDETGDFRPNDRITRAEFMAFINRIENYSIPSDKVEKYTDVKKSDWYYDTVAIALGAGYINGVSANEMKPNELITREQAMVIMTKVCGVSSKGDSYLKAADSKLVSPWARNSVSACIEAGFVVGNKGKVFPLSYMTRAEAIVMLNRKLEDHRHFAFEGVYDFAHQDINSITVSGHGVTLRKAKIIESLTISKAVGYGNVTLEDIIVNKKLFVFGGGASSIHLKNVVVNDTVYVKKDDHKIRISIEGESDLKQTMLLSGAIIENKMAKALATNKVVIPQEAEVEADYSLNGNFKTVDTALDNIHLNTDAHFDKLVVRADTYIDGEIEIDKIKPVGEGIKLFINGKAVDLYGEEDKVVKESKNTGQSSTSTSKPSVSLSTALKLFNLNGQKKTAAFINNAGTQVLIYFDKALDKNSLPDKNAFTLSKGKVKSLDLIENARSPYGVLKLKVDTTSSAAMELSYQKPKSNALRFASGAELSSFSALKLERLNARISDVFMSADKKRISFTLSGIGYNENKLYFEPQVLVFSNGAKLQVKAESNWLNSQYMANIPPSLNVSDLTFALKPENGVLTDIAGNQYTEIMFDKPSSIKRYEAIKMADNVYYENGSVKQKMLSGEVEVGREIGQYYQLSINYIVYDLEASDVLVTADGIELSKDSQHYKQKVLPKLEQALANNVAVYLIYDTTASSEEYFRKHGLANPAGDTYLEYGKTMHWRIRKK